MQLLKLRTTMKEEETILDKAESLLKDIGSGKINKHEFFNKIQQYT